jgi:hypothetical protein
MVGNKMYVIGGNRVNHDRFTMYRLDCSKWLWEGFKVKASADGEEHVPLSLDEHTASITSDEKQIVTFGGFIDGERSNHVHIFDTVANTWTYVKPANPLAECPSPRSGSSAVIYQDKELYVFGGKDDNDNKLNDFWMFDIVEKKWT